MDRNIGIKDRLRGPRDYLVILKGEEQRNIAVSTEHSITLKYLRAYVFQVQGIYRHLKYEPFLLRDSDGTLLGTIAARTGVDFTRLWDANGEDILRVKDDPFLIYHFSVAVQQPEIRIYPRIPADVDMDGWEYLNVAHPSPTAGDPHGYVAGREIEDYYNPPVELETIGWRGKERESNRSYNTYGFFNESHEKRIDPILNIFGAAYILHPVTDEETKRKIVAGTPVGPARTLVYLGPVTHPYSLPIPTDWDVVNCWVDIDRATLPQEYLQLRTERKQLKGGRG